MKKRAMWKILFVIMAVWVMSGNEKDIDAHQKQQDSIVRVIDSLRFELIQTQTAIVLLEARYK